MCWNKKGRFPATIALYSICLPKDDSFVWFVMVRHHHHPNLFLHAKTLCFAYIFSTGLFCPPGDQPSDHLVGNIQQL
jgi:hypothetical protein